MLKLATRELLDKFGSLEKAAAVCRVKPANLSQYQNFEHSAFMPIDVMLALEDAAGEAVVTGALAKLQGRDKEAGSGKGVLDEALDIPVAVGELLAFIREATSPDSPAGQVLSESEKRRYFNIRQQVARELEQLDAAVERDSVVRLP